MSTTAIAPTLEDKPQLSHELFLHHMNAMAVHFKSNPNGESGPTHVFAMPIHALHPVNAMGLMSTVVPTGDGKAAMDQVLTEGKAKTTAFAQQQRDFVSKQTNKLQSSHDTASFASQMNAQRAVAKQQSDQHIDDMFNKLIKVGTEHPALQSHILSATQQIGAFFTSLLTSIGAFFTDIFNKIVGWIKSAVDWVKGAAATIANWGASAVNSIGHFFSSIF